MIHLCYSAVGFPGCLLLLLSWSRLVHCLSSFMHSSFLEDHCSPDQQPLATAVASRPGSADIVLKDLTHISTAPGLQPVFQV